MSVALRYQNPIPTVAADATTSTSTHRVRHVEAPESGMMAGEAPDAGYSRSAEAPDAGYSRSGPISAIFSHGRSRS